MTDDTRGDEWAATSAAELGRYWDHIVERAPADPVPPRSLDSTLGAAVRRLHAQDDAPRADPVYADRLLEELMSIAVSNRSSHRNSITPVDAVSQPSPGSESSNALRGSRRWLAVMELAAMAAILLVLVTAVVWRDPEMPGFLVSDDATPTAPAGVDDPWIGGSSGTMSIPEPEGGALVITLQQLTFAPGASWTSPDGASVDLLVESGIIDVDYSVSGSTQRVGRGSGIGSTERIVVRNAEGKPSVATALLIGSGLGQDGVVDGVKSLVLGGGELVLGVGGQIAGSFMRYRLQPGDGERFDTGRDGIGLVVAEGPSLDLAVVAGEGAIRRATENGLASVQMAEMVSAIGGGSTLLSPGDSALVQRGAAFSIANRGNEATTVLVVTLEPNSALVQQGERWQATVEATPVQGTEVAVAAPSSQDLPLPEECTVQPRSLDALQHVLARQAEDATPIAAGPFQSGEGEEADAATEAAVTATMRELAACFNSGDGSRIFALYSDEFLRLVLDSESVRAIEQNEPLTGWLNTPMPSVWDVRLQADGRVTAKVEVNSERALVTFVNRDGRWLIDFFDDQTVIEEPPAGS